MKHQEKYQKINDYINQSNKIFVIPHIDPDPDAFASAKALILGLQQRKKNVYMGLQEEPLPNYYFLLPDPSNVIYSDISDQNFDLIITVDIGEKKRVGKYLQLLDQGIPVINLDHHIDNEVFGDIAIVDTDYSSTSEMVYEFLTAHQFIITYDIAQTIYTGIVFDTGSFRYSLTTRRTHLIVADLLKYNIDTNDIYEKLFENLTEGALKLRNKVTSTLELYCNGEVSVTYIKRIFYEQCGAQESDGTSLVKIGASILGVKVSVFLKEKEDNFTKVSLRSKGHYKVNEIAKKFGGGGHEKAAGYMVNESIDKAKDMLIDLIIHSYQTSK